MNDAKDPSKVPELQNVTFLFLFFNFILLNTAEELCGCKHL
jgi:hypothetical protein